MRLFAYHLLRFYDVFLSKITWKNIARVLAIPFIFIGIGLSIIAFWIFEVLFFVIIIFSAILALATAPFIWVFEKLFPNSPLLRRKEIPADFRRELIEASMQTQT